jgi:hypothetical protein
LFETEIGSLTRLTGEKAEVSMDRFISLFDRVVIKGGDDDDGSGGAGGGVASVDFRKSRLEVVEVVDDEDWTV